MAYLWISRPFKDVAGLLPCLVGRDDLWDSSGSPDRIKANALECLRGMPRSVMAKDGEIILLHNEQGGTLSNRATHLVTDENRHTVLRTKVPTVPLIARTLENCSVRLFDQRDGNHIYVARYDVDLWHCVVVRIRKHPPAPDGISGYLITQFPYEKGQRQGYFPVRWA